jgi:hypothetical protein
MSMSEHYDDKVRFNFIPLTAFDSSSGLSSYIRHTKPDYMLEVSGLNIEFEISKKNSSDAEKIIFPEPLNCFFLLNYGDLFISALNAIENKEFLEVCIISLFKEAMEKRDKCNEIVRNAIHQSTNCTDRILRANGDYSKAFSALSFTVLISLVLHEDEKMDGLFRAAVENLLTTQGLDYGAINPKQLQKNLNEHNLFLDITTTIRYGKDGVDEYSFQSLFDLIGYEVHQLKGRSDCIRECKNCGRLFIPASRSDEKYCDFIFDDYKTCKQVSFKTRLNEDETLKIYRKIYKTQNARKQRNHQIRDISQRFNKWKVFAKEQLRACQGGKITVSEMVKKISSDKWMFEG